MSRAEFIVKSLLDTADVKINGTRPWDIQLHDRRFYDVVLHKKALGLGETYMAGWWDCQQLDHCVERLFQSNLEATFKLRPKLWLQVLTHCIFNFQNKHRAPIVAKQHYDFGNDLFQCMLDDNLVYSCAYWKNADNLNQAQLNKLDLVCRKLQLSPGMRLLDIGCGWGSLAKYAAENYGVEVVGITLSQEQVELARINCANIPIDIKLQDYRDISGQFDRIASIGMFEHVGHKNYGHFMKTIKKTLAPEGLFLLHTMGSNYTVFTNNDWLEKYIFPNGMLPSIKQIGAASELKLTLEDWHNLGTNYHPTLMSWHHNFNSHWDDLKNKYGEQFRRMWNFYLLSCAGSAKARGFQVWQMVFSNAGKGDYHSQR